MDLKDRVQNFFKGKVFNDTKTLNKYARDASIFKVDPKLVCHPKGVLDIQQIVSFAKNNEGVSVTCRAGGSDMTGGPLSESIIVDVSVHLKDIKEIGDDYAVVEPGICYSDFEKETLKRDLFLPTFPASRDLCTIGGMIANNAGGEKTLRYGKTEDFVQELKVVLDDCNEYTIAPLTRTALANKMAQNDREGEIYRKVFKLVDDNYELLKSVKPKVSKNSAGYSLWNVWDKKTFDLTQLFVGSQGTLGIITEAKIRLIVPKKHTKLGVLFLKDLKQLPDLVNAILPLDPEGLETFDDNTLKLALRFFPSIASRVKGKNLFTLALQFIPEFFIGILMLGLPKLIILVEFAEDTDKKAEKKLEDLEKVLKPFSVHKRMLHKKGEAEKYWVIRRESFNLLRKNVGDKKATAFIDDFIVNPEKLPEILPKIFTILKKHGIKATLAGHAGSGNFHIIPLMDLSKRSERLKIQKVSDEVYDLVIEYGGSITAEHNDGLIRTPYLEKMYGKRVVRLFEKVKDIFDPDNIFNPGKKVRGSMEYMQKHIARE